MQTVFYQPSSAKEATKIYRSHDKAVYIAGGQSLVPLLDQGELNYDHIIHLDHIDELHEIKKVSHFFSEDALSLGAMVTYEQLQNSADVEKIFPGLARMMISLADSSVRNQGTVGGAVAFGDARSDMLAACLAMQAVVVTSKRRIAIDEYIMGHYQTALEPGELIKSIEIPLSASMHYAKFRHPSSRWALVGVAIGQHGDDLRVVVTGAGSKVYRDLAFEKALSKDFSAHSADAVTPEKKYLVSDHHADKDYRLHLIKHMVKEAIAKFG